jgi:hypothetical protein
MTVTAEIFSQLPPEEQIRLLQLAKGEEAPCVISEDGDDPPVKESKVLMIQPANKNGIIDDKRVKCLICESFGYETWVKGIVSHIKGVHGILCNAANVHLYNRPRDQLPDPGAVLAPNKKKKTKKTTVEPPPPPPKSESESEDDPLSNGPRSRMTATQPKFVCEVYQAKHTNPLLHLLQHVKPHVLPEFFQQFWQILKKTYPWVSDSGIFKAIMTGEIYPLDTEEISNLFYDENFNEIPSKQLILVPVNHENEVTTDDLLAKDTALHHALSREDAIFFMHFYLTSSIVIISNEQGYMEKKRINGRIRWEAKTGKNIKKSLERKSVAMIAKKDVKDISMDKFMLHHVIKRDLSTFECLDFTNDENPKAFPIWRTHAHPLVEEVNQELIQPFLDHVRNVICSGNESYYAAEMMKDAWMFQHPLHHMKWATVLVGEQGTGKNVYTEVLCKLWGEKQYQFS